MDEEDVVDIVISYTAVNLQTNGHKLQLKLHTQLRISELKRQKQ